MKRILTAIITGSLLASAPVGASAAEFLLIDTAEAKIEGNKVTGVGAEIDRQGYIVLHDECNGAAPASLGHLRLDDGKRYENLSISSEMGTIDPACNPTLMLHYETNNNQSYDFGPGSTEEDTPAMNAGQVVSEPVEAM